MVKPFFVMKKYFTALSPKIIWKTEDVPNERTELGEQIKSNCNLVVSSYT